MVYVISKDGKPLMPCSNVIARFLLESGKAKVKRKEPFTIKLLYETSTYTQPLTLGVDIGSKTAGFAVANNKNEVVYRSEVIIRDNVKKNMDQRRMYRRNRKSRKTRYRSCKFLNRKKSSRKNRICPTIESKINSHKKEIEYIKSILPICAIIFEIGKFDPAAMQNPSLRNPKVIHWGYQKGPNYGFANTKAKVMARDNYTCQICKGKSKDHKLHVHHIIFKRDGGSDKEDNLITLCEICHKKLHAGLISPNLKGKKKNTLCYAGQMNIIISQLLKKYPSVITTFGYITAENRLHAGFNKYSHWLDASIIATGGKRPIFKTDIVYIKRCVSTGDYKQTMGKFSEIRLSRCKIFGFRKFDKVVYEGVTCFIKASRRRGKPTLMNIYGKELSFSYLPKGRKTPKYSRMRRISARTSQMVWSQKISQS